MTEVLIAVALVVLQSVALLVALLIVIAFLLLAEHGSKSGGAKLSDLFGRQATHIQDSLTWP